MGRPTKLPKCMVKITKGRNEGKICSDVHRTCKTQAHHNMRQESAPVAGSEKSIHINPNQSSNTNLKFNSNTSNSTGSNSNSNSNQSSYSNSDPNSDSFNDDNITSQQFSLNDLDIFKTIKIMQLEKRVELLENKINILETVLNYKYNS